MSYHVLVVDDEPTQLRAAEATIKNVLNYEAVTASGGKEALDILMSEKGDSIDLVLLDLSMKEVNGMDVLRKIRPVRPDLPIVIHTAYGDVGNAVEALKEGAVDFVQKQDGPERLQVTLDNIRKMGAMRKELSKLKRSLNGVISFSDIIGESEALKTTKKAAMQAADSDIPVLISGESGVGKELFARAIHGNSKRSGQTFVPVNCGAIPENLIESVLFGHEKGSFTGAHQKTLGKFREADGGTLFLDEVGELKPDTQVKILRALQEGEIEPVGAKTPVEVNVRIISASNKNLREAIKNQEFREDLYYRIDVFPITIPPLRDREGDVEHLMNYFCHLIAASESKHIEGITDEAKEILKQYKWPGNIRQLENAIYRAVVMCEESYLDVSNFTQVLGALNTKQKTDNSVVINHNLVSGNVMELLDESGNFKDISTIESEAIRSALDFYDWHISKASRHLGMGRSTLYRKMKEYGIKDDNEPETEEERI